MTSHDERLAEIQRLLGLYGAFTDDDPTDAPPETRWLLIERHQHGLYFASWWPTEEDAVRYHLNTVGNDQWGVADLVDLDTKETSKWLS